MNHLLWSSLAITLLYWAWIANGQTCPDGFPAAFKCTASKKHKGGYYCKGDEKLSCELINGVSYCCNNEKNSELTAVKNETIKGQKATTASMSGKSKGNENEEFEKKESEEEEIDSKRKITTPDSLPCLDRGGDCSRQKQLCFNPVYKPLMRQECPFTCRYCSSVNNEDLNYKDSGENKHDSNENERRESCEDRGPDCQQLPHLCKSPHYATFMSTECPRTCNTC